MNHVGALEITTVRDFLTTAMNSFYVLSGQDAVDQQNGACRSWFCLLFVVCCLWACVRVCVSLYHVCGFGGGCLFVLSCHRRVKGLVGRLMVGGVHTPTPTLQPLSPTKPTNPTQTKPNSRPPDRGRRGRRGQRVGQRGGATGVAQRPASEAAAVPGGRAERDEHDELSK